MTKDEMAKADERAKHPRFRSCLGFDVPNLDGFSTDPMDYAALERVLGFLSLYCHDKRLAMQMRLKGDVEAALAYEKALERTYQRLPIWARW